MATSVNNIAATFSSCKISAKPSSSSKPTSISLPMTTTSMSSGTLSSPSVAWNPQATLPHSLKSAFVGFYGGPGPKPKSLNPTLKPSRRRTPKPYRSIKAEISVGNKLPEATFSYIDKEDNLLTITVSDLTRGKKVVLLAVPGAFTPTCSQKHLPGFVQRADELKSKGIDTIACISVNDAFVMKAWGDNLNVDDNVLLLADGNGYFTKAMGVALDLSDKPAGLGVRSKRYALVAEDGIVKILKLEEGGAFTVSGADEILESL